MRNRVLKIMAMVSAMAAVAVPAFATGTSMLDAGVTSILNDFAADLVPTIIALIGILVPVGLSLWAIGFAVKKGLNFLQSKANKAV